MDQIEDRLAIRDLTSRYAYYVDTFQNEKLMELWAEDAVFDESRVGTGLHVGARAIGAFFDELKKTVTHQAHITASAAHSTSARPVRDPPTLALMCSPPGRWRD